MLKLVMIFTVNLISLLLPVLLLRIDKQTYSQYRQIAKFQLLKRNIE